jgi:transcriptional regulator with XRE-family HTH domain
MARFKRLCIEKCRSEHISLDILANNIGIAKKTVLKLMDGSVPKMDTLIMIANYFGVSLDYLAAMDAARDPRFVSFFNAKYKEEQ